MMDQVWGTYIASRAEAHTVQKDGTEEIILSNHIFVLYFNLAYFLGATPQLKSLDLVHNPTDRFRLQTVAMGKVHLELNIIVRNFDKYGVSL
jgi:hypothetical protein